MPPQSPDALQFIQIRDFRPGIADVPAPNYPPGQAQRSGTFRCIANRSGGLEPLPKRQIPFAMPHEGTTPVAVVGLYVPPIGELPSPGGAGFNPAMYPEHELFVGTERSEGGTTYHKLRRYRRYETPGTAFDVIKDISAASAAGAFRPSGMNFGTTRSNRADPRQPGCPVVIAAWAPGFAFGYLTEFPDDQNQASNTPYDIFHAPPSTMPFILNMVCHQDKIVVQLATAYNQGSATMSFMGENMVWSSLNDVTTANWLGQRPDPETGGTSHPAVFVAENASGFGVLASMSANELFTVKGRGGMYVTGDLDTFATVVSLPMVTGAEINQIPAINNVGVVYGNRGSGIWNWSHGDSSRLLSPALAPDCWVLPSFAYPLDDFGGISYSFASMNEWIITPHNWLFDTQSGGWWRLEDDSTTTFRFNTSMWQYLYCSESYYTNASDTPISFYSRETPAASYSWQSQPLWETIDTLIDVRDITLRVRGSGQVTVTVTGETSSSSVTFTGISAILPVLLRQPIRVQDANVTVKIESSGAVAAPTVYECNVGYFQAQRERIRY